jgi:hypothetical protein
VIMAGEVWIDILPPQQRIPLRNQLWFIAMSMIPEAVSPGAVPGFPAPSWTRSSGNLA